MSSQKASVTIRFIEVLKSRITSSQILVPSSPGYTETIARWSDAAVKPAGAVLLAANAEEISRAVQLAKEHNIELVVRGGGHSVAGTSSTNGGLVIDLSRMRQVTVDEERKTITAQGGCLWADVDEAGGLCGLATVGGTVNHTGVGGLTLGGGYGWLTPKYGMVIDNLLSVTFVLADGRVVQASATEEPDLFWAARGAGRYFGVAVEFVYQAYDQADPVFAGNLVFSSDKLEAVVEAVNKTLDPPDENLCSMCIFDMHPDAPIPIVVTAIFYRGNEECGREAFKSLYTLGPMMDDATMVPYPVVNSLANEMSAHGGRRNLNGVFFNAPMRPEFARSLMNVYSEKMLVDPDMAGTALLLEYTDMKKCAEIPMDATACANRGLTLNGILSSRWNHAANDLTNRQWARSVQKMFVQERERYITGPTEEVPQYVNYADPGNTAFERMYGIHTERLLKLKTRYDSTNVFGKLYDFTPFD